MNHTSTLGHRLPLATLVALVASGCQVQTPGNHPVTASTPPGERFRVPASAASPEEVSPLGSHPLSEPGGRKPGLLANLTRHTFASVGRDFDPDPAPDGQSLVFASTRNSERPDIFVKNVQGYAVTQLTSDPSDDIQPRFSSDGQRIAFCSNRTGNWDIWLIRRDGTRLTQLTRDASDEVAPCWSPDGSRLAFTTWGRRSHRWEIWTLSVDRPGVRRFLCYGMFPDWSPGGKRIAFQRARQRGTRWFSIWVVDLVDGEARHPTELAHSEAAACIGPRWSPDGKLLVYCSVRQRDSEGASPEPASSRLWVVDAETGSRVQLANGVTCAFNAAWSSADRVFFVSPSSGIENIWSLQAGPGARTAVEDGEGAPAAATPANQSLQAKGK